MSVQSEPFVSVVTPVYNTEPYLAECIESVLAQTHANWEYVIVNNRSTDRSLEIAEDYAARDSRIRVITNPEFLNLMPNWNHAMRQISPDSKYCKVVHADDWLFPECLSRMVDVAEAHPTVGLVGAYRLEENRVDLDGLPYPSTCVPGRELARMCFLREKLFLFGSPTSSLLRSDLVRRRHDFYNNENIHADTEACFDILRDHDFGFVHQVLTYTRRHNEAMTSKLRMYNTRRCGKLVCLKKFGPVFLTPQEYSRRMGRAVQGYHNFLAASVFERKGKDFWEYHKNFLREQGIGYSRLKMVRPLILGVLERLLHLKSTVRSLVRGSGGSQDEPATKVEKLAVTK
jgi:glycosyltransferase involved in cell wall biosynthesis